GDTAGGSRPDRCEGSWSGADLPRPGDQAPDAVPRARCGVRRSSIPDSRARRASAAPADPNRDLPSDRTPADAKASRNIRVPWTYLSLLSARVVVGCVRASSASTCLGCGRMMTGVMRGEPRGGASPLRERKMRRVGNAVTSAITPQANMKACPPLADDAAAARWARRCAPLPTLQHLLCNSPEISSFSPHPRLRAGDDLHGNTGDPSDHDQPGPADMRLLAQDDDGDRGKRGQRRAEGADCRQEFGGLDVWIVIGMERKTMRGVDAEIEADRPQDHHDQQKALRGQRAHAGADMGRDEQAAGSACHRQPEPFEEVGGPSDAELHGPPPPIAGGQLSLSSRCTKLAAPNNVPLPRPEGGRTEQ